MAETLTYRFQHIHIFCSDLSVSEQWFVEKLGAQVRQRFEVAGTKWALLDLGGAPLLLMQAREGQQLSRRAGRESQYGTDLQFSTTQVVQLGTDHFGLSVDDLDATAAELKRRGVKFSVEPMQYAPGIRIAFVVGPDDVSIELAEGIESAFKI